MVSYRQALATNPNDPALWLKLSKAAASKADAQLKQSADNDVSDQADTATNAAMEAFLKSESVAERGDGLTALAHALELKQQWRESILTYRAALALAPDTKIAQHLDAVVAQHGFRVTSNSVDAEAASPRICVVFSDPLPDPNTDLSGYVVVDNAPQAAVEQTQSQICITGIDHGQRYHVKLRAGLPSADGEKLRNDVDLNLYVPDRKPFVGFANNAYVLPAGLGGGLPLTSVNAKTADVVIYRIGDRAMAETVRNGIFQNTLDKSGAEDIADQYGQKAWEGHVDLAQGALNAQSTTAIPDRRRAAQATARRLCRDRQGRRGSLPRLLELGRNAVVHRHRSRPDDGFG